MQTYIAMLSAFMFCLSLAAAVTLYANPKTFRVSIWAKAAGYLAFVIDIGGGVVAFMWATMNLPDVFAEAALAMVLTSSAWLLAVFIFVHAFVIPAHRKELQ